MVGGETSEQPGVLAAGRYILSAAVIGVVERDRVIDGSAIAVGDIILALASNRLHTNGYTLVRKLLELQPGLVSTKVDGETFLQAVLRPHRCYYRGLCEIFSWPEVHGLAHITGGGLEGNVARILPKNKAAVIDLDAIRVPRVFKVVRDAGGVSDAEMLRTFNLGVGMAAVVAGASVGGVQACLAEAGYDAYAIGSIVEGHQTVEHRGVLHW